MKKLCIPFAALFLTMALTATVLAAGSAVPDETFISSSITVGNRPMTLIKWDWTGDTPGETVTGNTTRYKYSGKIVQIFNRPDTEDNCPSDDYDIVINGSLLLGDVLNGAGANLPNEATSVENRRTPTDFHSGGYLYLINETLTFVGTNLGVGAGDFYILIDEFDKPE